MQRNSEQAAFVGFTPHSLNFFRRLGENNNKEWFAAHRREYETVLLEPFKALVGELSGFMLRLDPQLMIVEPSRLISRIHRDTRFSADKSPYRTNLWFSFKRFAKDWQSHPCWFFEMAEDWYRYGMGYYSAPRPVMDAFRQELEQRPARFCKVVAPIVKGGFTVEGESYKRPLKADLPEDLRAWHQRKNFYVVKNGVPGELLFSPGLVKEMEKGFKALLPLYDFMWELEERGGPELAEFITPGALRGGLKGGRHEA